MTQPIQAIRGMNDILPEKTPAWQYLENLLQSLIQSYGYQEIRLPLLENTALFKRAIGEITDIVEKEMYTFLDRNGDSVSLRPEGTASCVRACLQNQLLYNQTQKLWYSGPMFRYERPQKGRYRQFYQLGVEAYGFLGIDIELEIILMTAHLWKMLNIETSLSLEINTLGTAEERQAYREMLVAYFKQHIDLLDDDSLRRLEKNPLRILDSKKPELQSVIEKAPRLIEYLQPESKERFDNLCQLLTKAGITFHINTRLVRGLDYYNHTVFEWVTSALGAQGTICAGGRYDSLVSQLSGNAKNNNTGAFGFGLGVDRLLLFLEEVPEFRKKIPSTLDIFVIFLGNKAQEEGLLWLQKLRIEMPGYRIGTQSCSNLKSQLKKADKSGASIALIMGDNEITNQTVGIKFLRENDQTHPQTEVPQKEATIFLQSHLQSHSKQLNIK